MELQGDHLSAAREWLMECFPDQEEEIIDASAKVITKEVARHFDGGVEGFLSTF